VIPDKFRRPLGDEYDEDEITAEGARRYVTGKSISPALHFAVHTAAGDAEAFFHGPHVHAAANLSSKRQVKEQDIAYEPRLERMNSSGHLQLQQWRLWVLLLSM